MAQRTDLKSVGLTAWEFESPLRYQYVVRPATTWIDFTYPGLLRRGAKA